MAHPGDLWDTHLCNSCAVGPVRHTCVARAENEKDCIPISLFMSHKGWKCDWALEECWCFQGGRWWEFESSLQLFSYIWGLLLEMRTKKRQKPLRGIVTHLHRPLIHSFKSVSYPRLASDPLCRGKTFFHSKWLFTPFSSLLGINRTSSCLGKLRLLRWKWASAEVKGSFLVQKWIGSSLAWPLGMSTPHSPTHYSSRRLVFMALTV